MSNSTFGFRERLLHSLFGGETRYSLEEQETFLSHIELALSGNRKFDSQITATLESLKRLELSAAMRRLLRCTIRAHSANFFQSFALCEPSDVAVSSAVKSIPTTSSDHQLSYLKFIVSELKAGAHILEVGPWLGASTCAMFEGLMAAGNRQSKLTVVDSFLGQPWMNFVPGFGGDQDGDPSFLDSFRHNLEPYASRLRVRRFFLDDLHKQSIRKSKLELNLPRRIGLVVVDSGIGPDTFNLLWQCIIPHLLNKAVLVLSELASPRSLEFWDSLIFLSRWDVSPLHRIRGSLRSFVYQSSKTYKKHANEAIFS